MAFLAVAPVIKAEPATRRRRLAFLPLIRWLPPARLCLSLPLAVILILLLKPLWVFCFGILKFLQKDIKFLEEHKILQLNI